MEGDNAKSDNSSLSLSITPPLSFEEKSSISEHLEQSQNDRSISEVEISPDMAWINELSSEHLSNELKPSSLDSSTNANVRSILEEILNNEQFFYDKEEEKEEKEESLDIFAHVDLDDKNLINLRMNEYEGLRDSAPELDSFNKELRSNSISLGTSTTEYKQLHEDFQNKIVEYHKTIVYKDDLIQKLTDSLQQSIQRREELEQKSDYLKQEILKLQQQIKVTTNGIDEPDKTDLNLEDGCAKFEETLSPSQTGLFINLKIIINKFIEQKIDVAKELYEKEMENLRFQLETDRVDHENEIIKLKEMLNKIETSSSELLELRQGLDEKHSQEMEELRTYFEKKCSDLEKNYSEEVFSQQSRKLSNSSCASDLPQDIVQNCPGPGGDGFGIDFNPKKLEKFKSDLTNIMQSIDKDEDYSTIRANLEKCDFINAVRIDLRNKYNAELEILREDFDNRVDSLNFEFKEKEEKLRAQVEELRKQVCPPEQEVISGDFEIDEVVQSYERRLQEQIALARIDFISAFENQIQRLANSDNIEDWPEELLKIKQKFEEKYQEKIERLENEITKLKRRSLSGDELELIKDRDNLKKQIATLKKLIGKLLNYFNQCEDELNTTLVDELLKNGFDKSLTLIEDELNKSKAIKLINYDDIFNLIDDDKFESIDLNLEQNLEKLRLDANAILTATNNLQHTSDYNHLKEFCKNLEIDKNNSDIQLEQLLEKQKVLEQELIKARQKIAELIENNHREIVSEGYGEEGGKEVKGFKEAVDVLVELQDKARVVSENTKNMDPNLMQLVEEFARVGDKIVEEARKERDDLRQQILAADKKYRVTCHFLEDQANEREQERDEAQKEIDNLKEQLKDRNKDRESCERFNSEVEELEKQIKDLTNVIKAQECNINELESQKQEAVDKIYDLREIIRDLEVQLERKCNDEIKYKNIIKELEGLVKPSKSPEVVDVNELKEHIINLEEEVQRLRLANELVGSEGALKQIKTQLNEFENCIEKKTKDLEGLHISNTCCSSPSEDMSIRDVVNPTIPPSLDECELPLQQLARLKDKLVRHSRAEDAAVKRLKDLEMQLFNNKNELEEYQSEREVLKKQIADQVVLISSLQIRLDDQRIRAEHIEKQTNSSLECKIYDLQNELDNLEEKLHNKDKLISQLKSMIDDTQKRLNQEKEREDEMIILMQKELENLRRENCNLKEKLNDNKILPNLVENIISDKNTDIGVLKEKLSETEKLLQMYSSLSLDKTQIDAINKLKQSGLSFVDLVEMDQVRRAVDCDQESQSLPIYRRAKNETTHLGEISSIERIPSFSRKNSTEISKIEKHVRFEVHDTDGNEEEEEENPAEELERLKKLMKLEDKVGKLQKQLEETEENFKKATAEFEQQLNEVKEQEKNTRLELIAKKVDLQDKEQELKILKEELEAVDQFNEKVKAENEKIKDELIKNNELNNENKINMIEEELEENIKQQKLLNEEVNKQQLTIASNNEELLKKQQIIDKLTTELKRYQNQINNFQQELNKTQKMCTGKDIEIHELKPRIEELTKEINHLQALLVEKDKVINQMSEDSKSLQVNLETIQAKLQETGNIVDLGRRLREEQKRNLELTDEVHNLKAQLFCTDKIDEIAGQVQRELDYSNYLDATIISAVNEDQDLRSNLNKQEAVAKQLTKAKDQLQYNFDEIKKKYDELKMELEKEKINCNAIQLQDANLIEQLRIKLEAALDNEVELQNLLEAERKFRSELEKQIEELKLKSSVSESTEYKQIPSKEALELSQLKKEMDKLRGENKELSRNRSELENNLKYSKDLLNLKIEENKMSEQQLKELKLNEEKLNQDLFKYKQQLEERDKEVENTRQLIEEIDQDRLIMKKRIDALNENLKQQTVPEHLANRIKELNEAVQNNKDMVNLITQLTHEKKMLEIKITQLQNDKYDAPPFDPAERANYLFAKYLRADSYRKALIFQKRFLCAQLMPFNFEKTKKNRFKTAVIVLISINRMRNLVQRWHSGVRIVKKESHRLAVFQVGQPVLAQNFVGTNSDWTGQSPPSKEVRNRMRESDNSRTLTSPGLLSKYVERFNQIQEKLGLVLDT